MVDIARPLFTLGRTLATAAALRAIEQSDQSPADFLDRHVCGDWGTVSEGDGQLNDEAVKDGSRILSSYLTGNGTKIWVITEAKDDDGERAATTILLPEEY
jgi:hypothetical protein